jgi:uncharacterized protein DUF3142
MTIMRAGAISLLGLLLFSACRKEVTSPLPQRAYVWQRDWNAPVAAAIQQSRGTLAGFVVLAAEVEWKSQAPHAVKPRLDWAALRGCGKPVSIALRIAPHGGPFEEKDATTQFLCATARELIASAKAAQLEPAEFQLDFDCAQKKLSEYAKWVRAMRGAIQPMRIVITALPSWLDEPAFPALVREAGHYVLQVHSVASPLGDAHAMVCDPALARKWVTHAEKIGLPFEIALPTYRSVAGYDTDGKLLGVVSDGVRPAWPVGTRMREYSTDAEAMARLVDEWTQARPPHCEGLLWYRLPVETDRNNWHWPTLQAVMAGRVPRVSRAVLINGAEPAEGAPLELADVSLLNNGESDDLPREAVEMRWDPARARAMAEALPGWDVSLTSGMASFSPRAESIHHLPPGEARAIGWLRLEPAAPVHVEITR